MKTIIWKLHLKSNPKIVFDLLTTSDGRAKFWSKEATVENGVIHFLFPNGETYHSKILRHTSNKEFHIVYFDSLVKFSLTPSEGNGTDLTMTNENVMESDFSEVKAGWVSVLMNLKAVADFQCDLRTHDPKRTWDQGYADN